MFYHFVRSAQSADYESDPSAHKLQDHALSACRRRLISSPDKATVPGTSRRDQY